MRKGTAEYKRWLQHRNKKNLKRRTKQRAIKKSQRASKCAYDLNAKEKINYNPETKKFVFTAPLTFSIVNNADETIGFFNELIRFISNRHNFGKHLFIDISPITSLTSDALMYLLAIVNNLSINFKYKYDFSGNRPADKSINEIFEQSGFYRFVKRQGTEPLSQNSDSIQIVSGEACDNNLAKRISDFICSKTGKEIRSCSFMYNMMIELMSNTHKHAYEDRGLLHPRWYCFADFDSVSSIMHFTFMDTGCGIPSTVQKQLTEIMAFDKQEHSFVVSALNGEFRTATKKGNRGKGLPKIREFCAEEKIKNLKILSNKASVQVRKDSISGEDMKRAMIGTLYCWDLDINQMKGA